MTESAHDQARESAKRTTETISYHAHLAPFCRPFHGLIGLLSPLT